METILPAIYEYLDHPFELAQVNKSTNSRSKKCILSFYLDENHGDVNHRNKQLNNTNFQRYKWRYIHIKLYSFSWMWPMSKIDTFLNSSIFSFAWLKNLKILNFEENTSSISDHCLQYMPNLVVLIAKENYGLLGMGLKYVPNLRCLSFPGRNVLNDDLKYIPKIKKLRLSLNSEITMDGLTNIADVEVLELPSNKNFRIGTFHDSDVGECEHNFLSKFQALNLPKGLKFCITKSIDYNIANMCLHHNMSKKIKHIIVDSGYGPSTFTGSVYEYNIYIVNVDDMENCEVHDISFASWKINDISYSESWNKY